ncbi:MAG: ABA4-like family protein [Pseudomonadota bacterium]
MDLSSIFDFASTLAIAGWGLLVVHPLAPRWIDIATIYAIPLALSVLYTALILAYWSGLEGGFDSFANVMLLFTQEEATLAGWTHFLAFDLMIGAISLRYARREGVPHLLMLPALYLTLMFGPAGLLTTAALITIARATRRTPSPQGAHS